jgi:hypothetical protein
LYVSSEHPKLSYHRNALFGLPELNLCSIDPLVAILLVLEHPTCTQAKGKTMPYRFERLGSDKGRQCAVCEGDFGLVRHCSWRTPLCSKKCIDRFKAHRKSDHDGFLIAFDQTPEDRTSAS